MTTTFDSDFFSGATLYGGGANCSDKEAVELFKKLLRNESGVRFIITPADLGRDKWKLSDIRVVLTDDPNYLPNCNGAGFKIYSMPNGNPKHWQLEESGHHNETRAISTLEFNAINFRNRFGLIALKLQDCGIKLSDDIHSALDEAGVILDQSNTMSVVYTRLEGASCNDPVKTSSNVVVH